MQLLDTYVQTPATPYLGVTNVASQTLDSWLTISSDLLMKQLPPIPESLMAAEPNGARLFPGSSTQRQQWRANAAAQ